MMIILDGNRKLFYVELPKGTREAETVPVLHACVMMIDAAKRAGCEGFLVQEPGQRSVQVTMAAVEEEYKKNPVIYRGLRGIGTVYGAPDIKMVNVGGRHLMVRKVKQTRGGLLVPA